MNPLSQPDESTSTDDPASMTPEQLAEARRYGRLDLVCDLADRALDVSYLGLFAMTAAMPVDRMLQQNSLLAQFETLRLAALFFITIAGHIVVSLPLSYYSGYVLEHQFGMSTQSRPAWIWSYAKRNLLAVGFGLAMFCGLYWVIWWVGAAWWIVAAGAFFVVSVVLGQLAPVIILPLFYSIQRLERPDLTERLQRLAEGTGLSLEGIYCIDLSQESVKANAMLTGLGRTRRVLLGDTLLDQFTADEIEVIFGHEVAHHVYRHVPKMIATGGLFSLAGFWMCDRAVAQVVRMVDGGVSYADFPIWTLPLLMFLITLFSLALEPFQNFISRRYERQCDQYALHRTGLHEAYKSAFRKLAKINKDDPAPNRLAVFLLHSHPPISERLAMANRAD